MVTPYLNEEAQARHQQFLQEAQVYHLAQVARTQQPRRYQPILVTIGNRLIAIGHWLKTPAPSATQQV